MFELGAAEGGFVDLRKQSMEAGPSGKHRIQGRLQRLPALSLGKDLGFLCFPNLQVEVEAQLEAWRLLQRFDPSTSYPSLCSSGFPSNLPGPPSNLPGPPSNLPRGFPSNLPARLATFLGVS